MQYVGKNFQLGSGKAGDEVIEANNAGLNKPALKYNDTLKKWQCSNDGVNWLDFGGASGGMEYNVSDIAPTSPNTNDIWIDTSTQSSDIGSATQKYSVSADAPVTPNQYDVWIDVSS